MNNTKFYGLEDLLPIVDETSTVLSKEDDGIYVAGVEHGDEFYPMFTSTNAEAAAVYASEMQKVLAERFAPVVIEEGDESEADAPSDAVAGGLYTLDQVIPMVDGSARSYCDLVVDVYVVGVSYRYDKYPIAAVKTAEEADSVSGDIDRLIDETYKAPKNAKPTDEDAALLEGFLPSPNKGLPRIKVGVNRLFLSGETEKQLGIKRKSRVILAYRPSDESIAIIKPETPSLTEEMRAGGYFVSAKNDIACARLFRDFGLSKHEGKRFYADKTSLSGNVVIFRR